MNKLTDRRPLDYAWIGLSLAGLAFTFIFSQASFLYELNASETIQFIIRRVIRVVLNDFFMMLIIVIWFKDWGITRVAIAIQLIDGLLLLPLYLTFKLHFEGPSEISSPLFSQFHRIIINPTLMILLIPAVYFQRFSSRNT
jgi:exosortase F-associated protein